MVQAGLSALYVLLIAVHVGGLITIAPMQRAEAWLYDAWLKRTAMAGVDDRVVILDIDESSLKSLGRWPWSRDTMTALVDNCSTIITSVRWAWTWCSLSRTEVQGSTP
jgi:adenylate cyclase